MYLAIDFGITNTDIVISRDKDKKEFFSLASEDISDSFFQKIFNHCNAHSKDINEIAITGGKSSSFKDELGNIPILKVNEIDAIGYGAKDLYDIKDESFVVISAGTGTACVHGNINGFNHLGGISVGGGTLQGLSNILFNASSPEQVNTLALEGNKNNIDLLIGDVVNEIGSLYPEITASNFAQARNKDNFTKSDLASSLSNMVGEVIGTVSYLNALLCGVQRVYFIGRTSLNKIVKKGIEERLKLANIQGHFIEGRQHGNVRGALKALIEK